MSIFAKTNVTNTTFIMEEKILLYLKDTVKNSTFSERTFTEVAETMTKTITSIGIAENKVEEFLQNLLPVFKTFQGDTNRQIVEAVKKSKPAEKEKIRYSGRKSKSEVNTKRPLTANDIAFIVAEANKPLLEKINLFEVGSKRSFIIQEVKRQLKTQYNLDEELCDKIIGYLDIAPESTIEKVAKNVIREYNEFALKFGLSELV